MSSSFNVSAPFNFQAERSTLGSILLEREAIIAVAPFLTPGHFYLEKHGLIYEAALECYGRRIPPDLAMVGGGRAAAARAPGPCWWYKLPGRAFGRSPDGGTYRVLRARRGADGGRALADRGGREDCGDWVR